MKTIKTLKEASKIYVNGYNAKFMCMIDDYTVAVSLGGENVKYIKIEDCELRLTDQILNKMETIKIDIKKAFRFTKTFCKLNKELIKGIAFGVLFMSLIGLAFKFMM